MKEHNLNVLFSTVFVSVAYVLIVSVAALYIYFANNPEALRIALWTFYAIAILGLSAFGALRSIVKNIRKIF